MFPRQELPAAIKCGASAQLELNDLSEAAVMNMEVLISQ